MKKAGLYSEIQKLKKLGFKKNSVANQLKINWRTVDRYWEIPVERLENPPSYTRRNRKLDEHRDAVLNMLRDYPAISAAQVCNWLKDSCGKGYSLRTVSRFIKELREAHNITKKSAPQPNDPHQTKNAEADYLKENLSVKPSKRMAKSELTKQLLFDAATRLFQKKGFHATSVEDIAAAAGTSVGAFYYHFKCKEDLIYIWANKLDEEYYWYYQEKINDPSPGNAMDLLRGLCELSLDVYCNWGSEFASVTYSYMMRAPEVCDRMTNGNRLYYLVLSDIVKKGQEEGSIRRDIPIERIIRTVTMAVRGAIIDWCIHGGTESIKKRSSAFFKIYLDGVRPQKNTN